MKIDLIIGTRPEAIKLAPVYRVMRHYPGIEVRLVCTGQHDELLRGIFSAFELPEVSPLSDHKHEHGLAALSARLLTSLDEKFTIAPPDLVVVQGDTSSAFFGALAAFYKGIPIAHVEAGLRTGDLSSPFPEEFNRKGITQLASLHFAPTKRAFDQLKSEGVEHVHLTGNTVVDAVEFMRQHIEGRTQLLPERGAHEKLALMTVHRRESHGGGIERICQTILELAKEHPQWHFAVPVHLNPKVEDPVRAILQGHERIHLLPPLSYPEMISLMEEADLLLTDSGGLQEEAPAFELPVIVLRDKTERMEVVEKGYAHLCGTKPSAIKAAFEALHSTDINFDHNPFGDGLAAERITEIIFHFWQHRASQG